MRGVFLSLLGDSTRRKAIRVAARNYVATTLTLKDVARGYVKVLT